MMGELRKRIKEMAMEYCKKDFSESIEFFDRRKYDDYLAGAEAMYELMLQPLRDAEPKLGTSGVGFFDEQYGD